jgi:hypothetical protein
VPAVEPDAGTQRAGDVQLGPLTVSQAAPSAASTLQTPMTVVPTLP